jgi:hypothetical protein
MDSGYIPPISQEEREARAANARATLIASMRRLKAQNWMMNFNQEGDEQVSDEEVDSQPWCWICEEYVKEGKCNCDK